MSLWKVSSWVFYDIPNEIVMYLDDIQQQPTEEESARNIIKMPIEQAQMIRRAKNLPMPSPPVKVVVMEDANIRQTFDGQLHEMREEGKKHLDEKVKKVKTAEQVARSFVNKLTDKKLLDWLEQAGCHFEEEIIDE